MFSSTSCGLAIPTITTLTSGCTKGKLNAAAGNAHLETTLTRYGNLATRIWCVAADRIPQLQEHISVHTALLTAVLEGRGDEAATIMLEHIRDFEEQVRRVL